MNDRTIKLIGQNSFDFLKTKTVAIIGVGGVGGYAVEALVRAGISRILVVDYDSIDMSNLNRQIISLRNNINEKKVDALKKRVILINPDIEVITLDLFLDEENIDEIFKYNIDYLIDACDTVNVKKLLIKKCLINNVKAISSMGTGNKLNPELFKIMDIRKTEYDPIAKILRKYIKDERIKDKVMVVCSNEKPKKVEGVISSISFMPSVAGLLCASYIINDIIKESENK